MRLSYAGLIFLAQLAWGQNNNLHEAKPLRRIYHFASDSSSVSEFKDPDFFLNSSQDFAREVGSLIEALNQPEVKITKDRLPAACLFPARKKILEHLLKKKFPQPLCPELQTWKQSLNTTRLSLVFAGAYSQNPASLFGHTMIRLSDESDKIRTSPLLSYVVGFLAQTGDDSALARFQKGLTGKYPGYFQIEPFYLKLGLYNNSESRDLWEVDIHFSKEEIDLFLDHLWEVSRFAKPYYFIKENCSYQLLKLLEAIKPELNLTSQIQFETLPHETVRILQDNQIASDQILYYPSLKKKLNQHLSEMPSDKQELFNKARKNALAIKDLTDVQVLDALVLQWQIKSYESQMKLTPTEVELLEATHLQRSGLPVISTTQDQVARKDGPPPAFLGHRPRQLRFGVAPQTGILSFRMGAHGFDQSSFGFDEFSAIQYLGFDAYLDSKDFHRSEYDFIVADLRSFESWSPLEPKKSWLLKINFPSSTEFQSSNSTGFQFKAGLGASHKWDRLIIYSLLTIKSESLLQRDTQTQLRLGWLNGFKIESKKHLLLTEIQTELVGNQFRQLPLFQWGYQLKPQFSLVLRSEPLFIDDKRRTSLSFESSF